MLDVDESGQSTEVPASRGQAGESAEVPASRGQAGESTEVPASHGRAGEEEAGKEQVGEEEAGKEESSDGNASDGDASEGEAGEREADSSTDTSQSDYVLEADPPNLLVYRWGEDVLRWELTSTEDGTRLILKHTLHDEGFSSAAAAGWHLCLDVADALMKGTPFGPVIGSRAKQYGWDDLNQRYAELLGVKPSFT